MATREVFVSSPLSVAVPKYFRPAATASLFNWALAALALSASKARFEVERIVKLASTKEEKTRDYAGAKKE